MSSLLVVGLAVFSLGLPYWIVLLAAGGGDDDRL
jgi:hypothetical protein